MISLDQVAEGAALDNPSRAELIAALARCTATQARLIAALLASRESTTIGAAPDRLLDVRAAAKMLNVSCTWLYRRPDLPFVTRIGSRIRYSERRLNQFISNRSGASGVR